jgi:hypothetical protein
VHVRAIDAGHLSGERRTQRPALCGCFCVQTRMYSVAPATLCLHRTLSLTSHHLLAARSTCLRSFRRLPFRSLTVAMAASAAGPKVGFFGAGQMCEALAKGFIRYAFPPPSLSSSPSLPPARHTSRRAIAAAQALLTMR